MKKVLFIMALFAIAFASCEKNEGKGGSSTIKGTVIVQEMNSDFSVVVGEPYPAQDVDVYIIYGSDEIYGDRFKTGYDGKYEFNYLQEGKYTVYVMSKDSSDINKRLTKELIPVFKEVEITDKNQVVAVEDINIID